VDFGIAAGRKGKGKCFYTHRSSYVTELVFAGHRPACLELQSAESGKPPKEFLQASLPGLRFATVIGHLMFTLC
jgi:hypothetical protein